MCGQNVIQLHVRAAEIFRPETQMVRTVSEEERTAKSGGSAIFTCPACHSEHDVSTV